MILKILNLNHYLFPALSQLNKYLVRYGWKYTLGTVFVILANLASIVGVEYTRKAVKSIEEIYGNPNSNNSSLILYATIVVLMPLVSGILTFLMRQTIIIGSRQIEFDLKNDIYRQYQCLSQNFYKQQRTGDLMARISEDVSQTRMYLGPGIMYTINLVVLAIMVISRMISIDGILSANILITLPILSLSIYYLSKKINNKSKAVQKQLSVVSSFVQDSLSGIKLIQSYNLETKNNNDYQSEILNYKQKNLGLSRINAFFFPLILLIIGLTYLFVLYIGSFRYNQGEIKDLGTIVAFFLYINYLVWPFTMIGWVSSVIQRAEASQQRINEFLNEKPDIVNYQNEITTIEGKIEFKKVNFTYKNTQIKAINNLSFTINKGETLAVLGTTASGKTTIAELLMRIYDYDSGVILIDDKPIKSLNLYHLRQNIGYVPQDNFLFSDTIYNNIAFGVDNPTKESVIQAAKEAAMHENITQFTHQYETVLGERGVSLSGGQRQRVAIARVLIKKPAIYIFDDSLSAVDTETEKIILNNLQRNTQKNTTLIITHRISSAKNADKIIVLDAGNLVEIGTHDTLIQQEGYYQKLYYQQINTNIF